METTTNVNEAADNPRSRRAMLAGVAGGLGAWLVAAAQRAMPAEAAAGDPVLAGRRNTAGEFSTELRARTPSPPLVGRTVQPVLGVVQLSGGDGLRAEAATGTAVFGIANGGLAVYGSARYGGNGVTGASTTGIGVLAQALQPHGVALQAEGPVKLLSNVFIDGDVEPASIVMRRQFAAPAAPSNNELKLFAINSDGKTQLCVRFATGDVQVLATQP